MLSEVSSVDITDWRRLLTFPVDFLLKIPDFFIIAFGMIFNGKIFLNFSLIQRCSFYHDGNFNTSVTTLSSSILLQFRENSLDIVLIGCFSIRGFMIVDGFNGVLNCDKYSETIALFLPKWQRGKSDNTRC